MSENLQDNIPQSVEDTDAAENTTPSQTTEIDTNEPEGTTEQQPTEQIEEEKKDEVDYSTIETSEQASEFLKGKGLDYDEFSKEFQASGALSSETLKKLTDLGIPEPVINKFIEGQKVLVQKAWEDIASTVGGMNKMAEIIDWAKTNLSAEEKKAYDSVHEPAVLKVLLKDLEKRMKDEEGYIPQYQLQGSAGENIGNYFESMAEVEEAINNPKYSNDPVYRSKVAKKITASREAGVLEIK